VVEHSQDWLVAVALGQEESPLVVFSVLAVLNQLAIEVVGVVVIEVPSSGLLVLSRDNLMVFFMAMFRSCFLFMFEHFDGSFVVQDDYFELSPFVLLSEYVLDLVVHGEVVEPFLVSDAVEGYHVVVSQDQYSVQ
jgi:hypothetical protein